MNMHECACVPYVNPLYTTCLYYVVTTARALEQPDCDPTCRINNSASFYKWNHISHNDSAELHSNCRTMLATQCIYQL